jgi:hypothetical protein
MKKIIKSKITMLFAVLTITVYSCSEIDDNYEKYLVGGEKEYAEKPEMVTCYPGNYRIKLSLRYVTAPRIQKCFVYWNNSKDSVIMDVADSTPDTFYVEKMLEGMDERSYIFDVYSVDNFGNKSLKKTVGGTVYGEIYRKSLINKGISSITKLGTDTAIVNWLLPNPDGAVELELKYEDRTTNNLKTKLVTIEELQAQYKQVNIQSTKLGNYKIGGTLWYRTIFKPEVTAIDTFNADYETAIFP